MTDRRWDTERQEWVYPAEWRPIDSAPKGHGLVLVYAKSVRSWPPNAPDPDPEVYISAFDGKQWWVIHNADMETVIPTHWMPLPEPPNV